jgi:hypothetical protein
MEAADFRRRSDAFLDAWNRHNVEDVVTSYTDPLVYRDPNTRGAIESMTRCGATSPSSSSVGRRAGRPAKCFASRVPTALRSRGTPTFGYVPVRLASMSTA